MIRTCKNCAGKLKYDIQRKGLFCENCGSVFSVEEYGASENEDFESDLPFIKKDETMDCNIFECSACGAEISVNGTESSTFCVYCGNPTIIFSRVAKLKKPDMIIPFKVSKDEALQIVKEKVTQGFFIPKEIKDFQPDLLRGIYIPYYVTKVEYDASVILSSVHKSGKSSTTHYYKRSAYCTMPWITTDASSTLSDSSSQRLEPYYFEKGAVEFDEDYLVGFYSDMSDVKDRDAVRLAQRRARDAFNDEIITTINGSNKKIVKERFKAEVYEKPITAMFPAWFLTFRYEDKPYTIIVNGQTGKTVGGVPWRKGLFVGLVIALSVLFTIAAIFLLRLLLPAMLSGSSKSNNGSGKFLALVIAGIIAALTAGIKKIKKVLKSIERTSASTLNQFAGKRQKGE